MRIGFSGVIILLGSLLSVVQCSGTNIIDTESDLSSPLDDLRELFESSDKCHALIKSLCGRSCRGTKTDSSKSCWRFCAHAHAEKLREAGCNIPDRKLIIGPSWTWEEWRNRQKQKIWVHGRHCFIPKNSKRDLGWTSGAIQHARRSRH